MRAKAASVRAMPFSHRRVAQRVAEHAAREPAACEGARIGDQPLAFVQEDWEGGFTVFLPSAVPAGQAISIDVEIEGHFIEGHPLVPECFYPLEQRTWLPRNGYLDRATFDLTYRHRKRERIASVGSRASEAADPADRDVMVTRYLMTEPVALAVFALGPFQRHTQTVKWEGGRRATPLEFNSVAVARHGHPGRLHAGRAGQRRAVLRGDVRRVSVSLVRRRLPSVRLRPGLSVAADDPADRFGEHLGRSRSSPTRPPTSGGATSSPGGRTAISG